MKKNFWIAGWVFVFSLSNAAQALAAMEPDAPASGSSSESQTKSFLDHVHLSYFAIYHGASFTEPTSARSAGYDGRPSDRGLINFDSEITAAYMVEPSIGVGITMPFWLYPVQGRGFVLGDVGVKTFHRNVVNSNGLRVSANLIVQAATSDGSKARDMSVGFKSTPTIKYQIPESRWAVGAWTELKGYAGVSSGKTFKLWLDPYVEYSFSKSLKFVMGYELELNHDVGMNAPLQFRTVMSAIEPGITWVVSPKFTVGPYLLIYTNNEITADKTALGAVISAALL